MKTIYEALKEYGRSDAYPFHMPGHKRRMGWLDNPFAVDITEIDGFDNLHCAEGIILEAQKRAAHFAHAQESFFLVNGSTCGILSAISTCVKRGGKILMARNSHKSAYHAVFLRDLEVTYLYPQVVETYGIHGGYDKEEIERRLEEEREIQAVFLTSPTYDGVVSDIQGIAKIVHRFGIPLIVDEAHGAHFGIAPGFPKSAVEQGADLGIESLHKTLPSLTQTAILHRNGSLINREKLKKCLQIYQTSSPSYVFIAVMDQCVCQMEKNGVQMFENLSKNLSLFRERTKGLSVIQIPGEELKGKDGVFDFDPSKLIISLRKSEKSGKWLMEKLRREYHLELEMASGDYALAMTSVGDSAEGFQRLAEALCKIDQELRIECKATQENEIQEKEMQQEDRDRYHLQKTDVKNTDISETDDLKIDVQKMMFSLKKIESVMRISQMEDATLESVKWHESVGRISGEYAYLYPPGIPLIVPGERITQEFVQQIQFYRGRQFQIQGLADEAGQTIRVASEE